MFSVRFLQEIVSKIFIYYRRKIKKRGDLRRPAPYTIQKKKPHILSSRHEWGLVCYLHCTDNGCSLVRQRGVLASVQRP